MMAWKEAYEAVLASKVLGKSDRQKKLLKYLFEKNASGNGELISSYAIAIDVFDRSENFDPQTDGIVRAEMARLRRKLIRFSRRSASFTIDLPKGGFLMYIKEKQVNTRPAKTLQYSPKIFLLLGLALIAIFGIYNFKPKSPPPLTQTFKAIYSFEIKYSNLRPETQAQLQSFEHKLQTKVLPNYFSVQSTQDDIDYKIALIFTENDLNASIYTKGGKLIWSKPYQIPPALIDREIDELISKVYRDIFDASLGNLIHYHATNPVVSIQRRELYKCAFNALTFTVDEVPRFIEGSPLDCLNPDLTSLPDEKSLIHVLRADMYSQAYFGALKIDSTDLLDKAEKELETAASLSKKSFNYYVIKLSLDYSRTFINETELRTANDNFLNDFPNNPVAQFTTAYISGFYLGDFDDFYAKIDRMALGNQNRYVPVLYILYYISENNVEKAREHFYQFHQTSKILSKLGSTLNIAYSCWLEPDKASKNLLEEAKKYEIASKQDYIDYVNFRNFHTSVTDILLDDKVLKNCPVFAI